MARRRRCSRRLVEHFLPPVLHMNRLSVTCQVFLVFLFLLEFTQCIMTFPEGDSGVYSLFPDEDLKTGRKRLRFEDDRERSGAYREGREYSTLVRSYPMLPHDRLHRPVDYSGSGGSRQVYDNYRDRDRDRERERERERERHGRVYFDDQFRSSRFDYHRLHPRPRPIERPVSPIVFETQRRPPYRHHHFTPGPYSAPPPAVGQAKLPPGASSKYSGEDGEVPTRIHVFDPESNNFGNPRSAGGASSSRDSSSERTKDPPSNFVETGPPGPDSFLNHEEFLEYQKKIAFSRFEEDGGSGGGGGSNSKKVLFESKEPFDIDGLSPPNKSIEEISRPPPSPPATPPSFKPIHVPSPRFIEQRPRPSLKSRGNGGSHRERPTTPKPEETQSSFQSEERDPGGGEVNDGQSEPEKGEVVESENGKSEVTQLPPTHITKSVHHHQNNQRHIVPSENSNSNGNANNKKFTPSISHDEHVGRGTGFRGTTPLYSDSGDGGNDEPNLHGFVPVVPFHLRAEPPRAPSLERRRQQQQERIVPVQHQEQHRSTTARSTTTTTQRSIPITTVQPRPKARPASEQYSGFRPASGQQEVKSVSSSSSVGTSNENNSNFNNNSGGGSPASPILHATAGERSNSETHTKVAITKGQELKRLSKQLSNNNVHQLTRHSSVSSGGLLPQIIDTSSSSEPDRGTGTLLNNILPNEIDTTSTPPTFMTPVPNDQLGQHENEYVDSNASHQHEDTKDTLNTTPIPTSTTSSSKKETIKDDDLVAEHDHKNTTPVTDANNADTLAVKTTNGIRQGEFTLEGYMLANGLSRSSANTVVDKEENNFVKFGSHPHLHGPPLPYDYDDQPTAQKRLDSVEENENNALSPQRELPGIKLDLEPNITPSSENTTPVEHRTMDQSELLITDLDLDMESVPTPPPEQEHEEPTPYSTENDIIPKDDDNHTDIPHYPYYKHYGNRVNLSRSSHSRSDHSRSLKSSSSSTTSDMDNSNDNLSLDVIGDGDNSSSEEGTFNRLSGSFDHSSVDKPGDSTLAQFDTELVSDSDGPNSISIPLGVTLNYNKPESKVEGEATGEDDSGENEINDDDDVNDDVVDPNAPIYLESSETLLNKTYYLDADNSLNRSSQSTPFKSMNFIKVTRIRAPSGPSSKETEGKTSATILARRTAKPAVIVSTTAAGARPRIIGSVVEAGPAWPGLISNFHSATVRPRGNSGTAPVARQVQEPKREIIIPQPLVTEFKLEQLRTPTASAIKGANRTVIGIGGGRLPQLKVLNSTSTVLTPPPPPPQQRQFTSSSASDSASEEDPKSSSQQQQQQPPPQSPLRHQIVSNSSTGVVQQVHAHISHCPKLHSPTEVICDVHIREGHGVANPQLTVGWRRKFYNSTMPDVLLTLNKAPVSSENGHFDPHHQVMELDTGRERERLEDFHDKFNVTLAPGISPMLRSVLLIRSVTAPDCGTYQCEVNDGINILKSETLLFLCH